MSDKISVHVACDHEVLRKCIAAFLDCHDQIEVRRTSPEGTRGVAEVTKTQAQVVVLVIPAYEDVAKHVSWYRDALSDAAIVGFCLIPEQAGGFREADVDDLVHTHYTANEFLEAVKRAVGNRDKN
ncbi:hypothetical protein [Botrimarina sp.]|uniref:hypothetical protein n=1 Tax=Botrimarina sp. TaxID=2795802 RepID=UPI0032EAA814